jgi:hypothetical protein
VSLSKHPSQQALTAFDRVLADGRNFWQVRCLAAHGLATLALMNSGLRDDVIAHLLAVYEARFCLPRGRPTEPLLPRPNRFDTLPAYFVQKTLPAVLARIKTDAGTASPEILRFLVALLRHNDNTRNTFSDGAFRASLIDALAMALVPTASDARAKPDLIILQDAVAELERQRFLDLIEPSYHNQVTLAVLQAATRLHHAGLAILSPALLWQYWKPSHFVLVRHAAVEALLLLAPVAKLPTPGTLTLPETLAIFFKWLLAAKTSPNLENTIQDTYLDFTMNDSNIKSIDLPPEQPSILDIQKFATSDFFLSVKWQKMEMALGSTGRPFLNRLLLDTLKMTLQVSTRAIETLQQDHVCKALLRLLTMKTLVSGRIAFLEPTLFMARLGLIPAPIPTLAEI